MKDSKRNDTANDDWATPSYIYDPLMKEFNFDFDPCPLKHDGALWSGLECEWGKVNFVNPPYSNPLKDYFIIKGLEEWKKGKTVVFLIPANTDTKIFHTYILPNCEIRFIRGRVKFIGINSFGIRVDNKCGLTGSMICILIANKIYKKEGRWE